MKDNKENILQELKELNAEFLMKEKQRDSWQGSNNEVTEGFYQAVMDNVSKEESHPIQIQERSRSRLLKVAASFLVLFALSSFVYTLFIPNSSTGTVPNTLDQLMSQTTYDEIYGYLYETGLPSDEDFLNDYLEL